MAMQTPFLSSKVANKGRCSLCNESIKDNEDITEVGPNGLQSLKAYAERWAGIDDTICSQPPYVEFRLAGPRLAEDHKSNIIAHKSCRINFRTRLNRFKVDCLQQGANAEEQTEKFEAIPYRMQRESFEKKDLCFVCNTETQNDMKPFNDGGLGRCSEDNAFSKIKYSMDMRMRDEQNKYHDAAKRLEVLLSGSSYDVFALDLYYHKTCYDTFTYVYNKKEPTTETEEQVRLQTEVMDRFFQLFQRSVNKDEEAFLLTELLQDIIELSSDNDLDDPPITKTATLKLRLSEKFGNSIDFHKIGKRLVVHSSRVNPLSYSAATIEGHGLRESDLTKAFARLIRRKVSQREAVKWPFETNEMFSLLDSHKPLQCIYNAICWSINPRRPTNALGYVTVPRKAEAEKISAVSQSWEKLVTGQRLPLGTALSLTIHRITGSKEATTLLNRCGVGIPYTDVRDLNNKWAKSVTMQHKHMLPPGFIKGRSVHVTFDNSDGRQQTLTGAHTTHHTTGTIFQSRQSNDDVFVTTQLQSDLSNITDNEKPDYGSFKIPKQRTPPPSFPDHKDEFKNSPVLTEAMERNVAWVLLAAVGDDCLEELSPWVDKDELGPVGSWTSFMKNVTICSTTKCKLDYLPVVPLPPGDNVIKWYMDMIVQMTDDLELDYIFVHADEAINSKMLMISWLNQERYDKIIPLMGGFHTILVNLKILHKKYACLGFADWWVDSGAIANGSVAQALEGRNYARSVRLHKQSFEALLRHRIKSEDVSNKLDQETRQTIAKLRDNLCAENLQSLVGLPRFKDICSSLLKSEGTQANMMVEYLKDVSALLCFILAVREKSIETHMAAERALLPKCFAFGHVNYARYLTFQHVNLQNIKIHQKDTWEDLVENGFGGSLSGEPFSTIHGDLITECTINREVKVRGGPMQGGYSTSEHTTDTFIKTSHIMAKVRAVLKERLDILTHSTHKEVNIGARRQHDNMITSLVVQLDRYFDPFLSGSARHMKTGVEISHDVVEGLLSSSEVGEKHYNGFVDSRLIATEDRTNFFEKIVNPKIKTGLEKSKKEPKAVNVLKEDRQAFGLLVGKATSPTEAHSYPLTSVPLALATPDRDLRQGSKAALRNYLIEESASVHQEALEQCLWLVDGMAAVNTIQPKQSWRQYADALLDFCLPPSKYKPLAFGIIFDSYSTASTKELTQTRRGTAGRRIHITSAEQSMPCGKDWDMFLRNSENKTELISFLVKYYKSDVVRSKMRLPLTVTEEEKTWLLTNSNVAELETCNHTEADTRLILHASMCKEPVIIRATDTDIMVLLCYAYSTCKPPHDWLMKIDHRFISISEVVDHFGDQVCQILPAYHSITGSDTTSYPYGIGKIKPIKKMLQQDKSQLLSELGRSVNSVQDITKAQHFFRTCMYPGLEKETHVETRIRMYQKQKIKSSMSILPDENSTEEHIKRSHLQAYIWYQSLQTTIDYPEFTDRGWQRTETGIQPVWFTCTQLPPSLSKKKSLKERKQGYTDYEADVDQRAEETSSEQPPRKRSKTVCNPRGRGSRATAKTRTKAKRGHPDCGNETRQQEISVGLSQDHDFFGDDEVSDIESSDTSHTSSYVSDTDSLTESDNYSDINE